MVPQVPLLGSGMNWLQHQRLLTARIEHNDILSSVERTQLHSPIQSQVIRTNMSSLNDLEFAYAPVRNQVRDLREYL